eukprot:CAMPEP_0196742200 /NCGR_PEP_ID=MMETSP1091-20130531/45228_1 /TAXON_ID=302021 /ORGANISM="Rhodomonas sp., Strain CCMP768" /LENGTH=108 /DNA_ID=CAMNT_0042088175 /DNA_START=23 /DNA_END=349 /DNA_ORIENTATION=+
MRHTTSSLDSESSWLECRMSLNECDGQQQPVRTKRNHDHLILSTLDSTNDVLPKMKLQSSMDGTGTPHLVEMPILKRKRQRMAYNQFVGTLCQLEASGTPNGEAVSLP